MLTAWTLLPADNPTSHFECAEITVIWFGDFVWINLKYCSWSPIGPLVKEEELVILNID